MIEELEIRELKLQSKASPAHLSLRLLRKQKITL